MAAGEAGGVAGQAERIQLRDQPEPEEQGDNDDAGGDEHGDTLAAEHVADGGEERGGGEVGVIEGEHRADERPGDVGRELGENQRGDDGAEKDHAAGEESKAEEGQDGGGFGHYFNRA